MEKRKKDACSKSDRIRKKHWERSTTLGNQGHENFVSIYIHGLSRLGLTGMVGTINIHLVHIWIPIEPSKIIEVTNSRKLSSVEDKEIVEVIFFYQVPTYFMLRNNF
ncbi:LOW QUALITY PROTEIN: hypothetical protein PHAVU_002G060900 [Phaseolus vulgaris]|uniref:Uncharacterized protein n=1 Tax=Phaseolus vulgaris TaxID=3885 RepID=V7CGL2_PHAVU|nr:hypothetical protein PHAVU_002G060900g [Phaseolus vulgaris]ESW29322.1 hypothetical protein PHAVU_002G060900g [Phaseolus vulgaris]